MSDPKPLHPTSILFLVAGMGKQAVLPVLFVAWNAASGGWTGVLGVAGLAGIFLGIGLVRYFTFRFQLREGELIVTEGILFRSKRNVPIARIQNVDSVQNLFHRLLRVAEVRVETASGTKPEAVLKVLGVGEVEWLRKQIESARHPNVTPAIPASLSEPSENPERSEPPTVAASTTLLRIPLKWLLQAGLASNRGFVMVGILFGLFFQLFGENGGVGEWIASTVETRQPTTDPMLATSWIATSALWLVAFIGVLISIRLLGTAWYVLRFAGYQLDLRDENLHVSCGLLTKVSATVPRRRIQWISVHRTPLQRWMKLASIRIETAGGAGKQNENAATTITRRWFVPIIHQSHLNDLLDQLRPGLRWDEAGLEWQTLDARAGRRMKRIAVIKAIGFSLIVFAFSHLALDWSQGWIVGLVAFAFLLPGMLFLAIRRHQILGYADLPSADGVAFRSGVWTRKLSCTFYDRIQSVSCSESPFDRRWKMQTVRIDTAAAGPADHVYRVPMLNREAATQLCDSLSTRTAKVPMVWD